MRKSRSTRTAAAVSATAVTAAPASTSALASDSASAAAQAAATTANQAEIQTLQLEDLEPQAVVELKKFFDTPEDNGRRADRALGVLSKISTKESKKLRLIDMKLRGAKAAGIKGRQLLPILTELDPAFANAHSELNLLSDGTAVAGALAGPAEASSVGGVSGAASGAALMTQTRA